MRRVVLSLSSEDLAPGVTKGGNNFLQHSIRCLNQKEHDFRISILPAAHGIPTDKLSLIPS